ncbi:MAG: cytochrome c [Acidimicrobiia bacterium]|nr:cytochrome c [Acidimicrobiia bacterium]
MRKTIIAVVAALMLAMAACSGGDRDPTTTTIADRTGDPVRGFELYRGGCIVCHGEGGVGIEGLGKSWIGTTFINESTDEELIAFLLVGRPTDDPLNTTGVDMLPKGGNNALTEDDLRDLVAFMRTLNL